MKAQVICVPGSVAPAAQRYGPLVAAVGESADLHLKDLEVYREDAPPDGYSIDLELDGIDRFAGELGLERFHLVAYSGGGFCSLAYGGTRPERVLSLSLFEAARIPGPLSEEEAAFMRELQSGLDGLTGGDFMSAFVRMQVKPGARLTPPPPPSAGMRKRPAGIAAMIRAFDEYPFDRNVLRRCRFPVFYGYGDLSHDEQALKAGILAQTFHDIHVRRFEGVHHFVPPEEIYTPEHAGLLVELWAKTEGSARELSGQ
jgi:pimeloyl-ACP methyl ester carboxylesterase